MNKNGTNIVKMKPEEAESPQRKAYFEISKGDDGRASWVLWSANGRALATSVVTYDRVNDCIAAITTVIGHVTSSTRIVVAHSGTD